MHMELTFWVDWLGAIAGVLGVSLAVYLQLINPRHCHPGHVLALFAGGSALVLMFSEVWFAHQPVVQGTRIAGIVIFAGLEMVGAYYVWKRSEAAPPQEAVQTMLENDGNGT